MDFEDKTDEEVVAIAQNNDPESFGVLIERYEDKIKRYARKFLRQNQDIEDVVQEVFIKAYINIQGFDPKKKFSPWLYRIAHNEFVNLLRKKEKLPLLFFDADIFFPHPVSNQRTDKNAEEEEIRNLIEKGLGRLPIKYREPLILYYLEDLDYKQISEILRLPISTIGVRLKRAREILKTIL
jgi:RNA polymerase sigma-70 factor (ECF subfamily)